MMKGSKDFKSGLYGTMLWYSSLLQCLFLWLGERKYPINWEFRSDTTTLFHLCFLTTRPIVQVMFLFICEMLWSSVRNCGLSGDGAKCYVVHMWRQVYGSWGFISNYNKGCHKIGSTVLEKVKLERPNP